MKEGLTDALQMFHPYEWVIITIVILTLTWLLVAIVIQLLTWLESAYVAYCYRQLEKKYTSKDKL